jgi:hypothetical protein
MKIDFPTCCITVMTFLMLQTIVKEYLLGEMDKLSQIDEWKRRGS